MVAYVYSTYQFSGESKGGGWNQTPIQPPPPGLYGTEKKRGPGRFKDVKYTKKSIQIATLTFLF